jgi:hypothetical protein
MVNLWLSPPYGGFLALPLCPWNSARALMSLLSSCVVLELCLILCFVRLLQTTSADTDRAPSARVGRRPVTRLHDGTESRRRARRERSRSLSREVAVRHGYPWVPTDQAHGHPRLVGLTYQKTRRPVRVPNRLSWRPTRPPEDLSEDSPDDLIQHDLKTWRTRQDLGGFRPKQIDRIWQAM